MTKDKRPEQFKETYSAIVMKSFEAAQPDTTSKAQIWDTYV
jgi:hypothetical protein